LLSKNLKIKIYTTIISGISVTRPFSRIYGRILAKLVELEHKNMEMEEQAGFRAEGHV
jgi:hypothetical protein